MILFVAFHVHILKLVLNLVWVLITKLCLNFKKVCIFYPGIEKEKWIKNNFNFLNRKFFFRITDDDKNFQDKKIVISKNRNGMHFRDKNKSKLNERGLISMNSVVFKTGE